MNVSIMMKKKKKKKKKKTTIPNTNLICKSFFEPFMPLNWSFPQRVWPFGVVRQSSSAVSIKIWGKRLPCRRTAVGTGAGAVCVQCVSGTGMEAGGAAFDCLLAYCGGYSSWTRPFSVTKHSLLPTVGAW